MYKKKTLWNFESGKNSVVLLSNFASSKRARGKFGGKLKRIHVYYNKYNLVLKCKLK